MAPFDWDSESMTLVDEVVDWTAKSRFFHKPNSPATIETRIAYSIKDLDSWFSSIDIDNEESYFVELNNFLEEVEGAFRLVHQYGPESFKYAIGRKIETIGRNVAESAEIKRMGEVLFAHKASKMSAIDTQNHLGTTITCHLAGAVHARALSVSRRCAQTETLFQIYQNGLFPFAWDWETLWCLDPSAL